jgi:uncharacterized protein YbaR (Trm112 family)
VQRLVSALILLLAAASVRAGQEPGLDAVLARAAEYVGSYQAGLRGVVAEETYRQSVVSPTRVRGRFNRESRELRSDVLMVRLANEEQWIQFRDVFEVDRKPVRDRDQRLYKLFVDAKPDARQQAETLQAESSRHNLGPLLRTINIPVMALYIFDRNIHPGVEYKLDDAGKTKRFEKLAPAQSVSIVEFKETTDETLIKGEKGRAIPSHGRAWIDKTNGRILQTELIAQDTAIRAQITVTYKQQDGIPVLVPDEMRETYLLQRSETRIDGRASYARFRQFTVTTTEKPKS